METQQPATATATIKLIVVAVGLLCGLIALSEASIEGLMETVEINCNKNLQQFVAASMELEIAQVCIENNACFTIEEQEQHFKLHMDKLLDNFLIECQRVGAWNVTLTTLSGFVDEVKNKSKSLGRLDVNHTKNLNCDQNMDNIVQVLDKFLEVARHMICAWQEICFTPEEYQVSLLANRENLLNDFRETGCTNMQSLPKEQERLFMSWLDNITKEAQRLGKEQLQARPERSDYHHHQENFNSHTDNDDGADDDDDDADAAAYAANEAFEDDDAMQTFNLNNDESLNAINFNFSNNEPVNFVQLTSLDDMNLNQQQDDDFVRIEMVAKGDDDDDEDYDDDADDADADADAAKLAADYEEKQFAEADARLPEALNSIDEVNLMEQSFIMYRGSTFERQTSDNLSRKHHQTNNDHVKSERDEL